MRVIRSRVALALVVVGVLVPGASAGQAVHQLGLESAVWHTAVRLRTLLKDGSGDPELYRRLVELELAMGFPERALSVLVNYMGSDSSWDGQTFALRGAAEYALGRYESAAQSFARAAEREEVGDEGEAVLLTRAGKAFELSARRGRAAEFYARARLLSPRLAPWLALREACTTDDAARARRLLAAAPPGAERLASRALGDVLLRVADTTAAIAAYVEGGFGLEAAVLTLARGDSVAARKLAYPETGVEDTAVAREAFDFVRRRLPAHSVGEFIALAAVARRLRMPREAAVFVEAAVQLEAPDAHTLVYWGDLLEESGADQWAASVYARAAGMEDTAARVAAFKQGRTLLRLGRGAAGIRVLEDFVERFPDDDLAARAVYTLADWHARSRGARTSDSLYEEVVRGWPRSGYASRARLNLATRALARGDTASAIEWYRRDTNAGGTEWRISKYRLASLLAAGGDTVSARGIWAELARADSLGYYGTIARSAAGLPAMVVASASRGPVKREVQETLALLDLLRASYLSEDGDALLASILAGQAGPGEDLLDFAEGLIARGHMREGIRLGWVAARSYGLNHPRVLRVVFPWPFRDLIEAEAREAQVDPHLLAALIRQESSFHADARSRAGAYGMMQLMPATAREVARRVGVEWDAALLTVPDANLHLGVAHFAALLRQYGDRVVLALAAYNAGGSRVRRWRASFGTTDPVEFVERVPFVETRRYLRTVLRNWALYKSLYPSGQAGDGDAP